MAKEVIQVSLDGRDSLQLTVDETGPHVQVVGCYALLQSLQTMKAQHGPDPRQWPVPEGTGHHELLLREWILRSQGKWKLPYEHAELCHCRVVATRVVEQAILAGAHTPEAVSAQTTASTACGTCRPDVAKIINYRLGKAA